MVVLEDKLRNIQWTDQHGQGSSTEYASNWSRLNNSAIDQNHEQRKLFKQIDRKLGEYSTATPELLFTRPC